MANQTVQAYAERNLCVSLCVGSAPRRLLRTITFQGLEVLCANILRYMGHCG
jgi:hypothetical protein